MQEINYLSPLSEIKVSLDSKSCSSDELVSEFIKSQEKKRDPYRCWVETLKQVSNQNSSKMKNLALEGLVIGVKDNISTYEFPTRMGTKHWLGASGGFDARVIHSLRSSGAVIGGKTECSEFAIHEPTHTINPRYSDCEPGTSSSGSAAAIAGSEVSLTLGTQTAGSIIKPASYCGVIGFKPTFGEIPRTGVLKTTELFDTVGFLGRRVDDISTVFNVAKVKGNNFPLHEKERMHFLNKPYSSILMLSGDGVDEPENDLKISFETFCNMLGEKLKIKVQQFAIPLDLWNLRQGFNNVYSKDVSYFLSDHNMKDKISEGLKEMLDYGSSISISNYLGSLEEIKAWRQFMREVPTNPLIVSLATSSSAPIKGSPDKIDSNLLITSSGNPQICLPMLRDKLGKLVGVTLSGKRFSDLNLLKLAKSLFPGDSCAVENYR